MTRSQAQLAVGRVRGGGGCSQVCLTLSKQTRVFRATMKSTLLLSEERQVKSKALSLQPLYLLLTVPRPGTFAEGGWCPAGAREELRPRLWPRLRPGWAAGGPLPVPWWLRVIQPLPRKDSRRPPTSSEGRPWGGRSPWEPPAGALCRGGCSLGPLGSSCAQPPAPAPAPAPAETPRLSPFFPRLPRKRSGESRERNLHTD